MIKILNSHRSTIDLDEVRIILQNEIELNIHILDHYSSLCDEEVDRLIGEITRMNLSMRNIDYALRSHFDFIIIDE